jgi:ankyrin repeat protein
MRFISDGDNMEIIHSIIKKYPDIDLDPALDRALDYNNSIYVNILVDYGADYKKYDLGLEKIIKNGYHSIFEKSIKEIPQHLHNKYLILTCTYSQLRIIKILIQKGTNVNYQNDKVFTMILGSLHNEKNYEIATYLFENHKPKYNKLKVINRLLQKDTRLHKYVFE